MKTISIAVFSLAILYADSIFAQGVVDHLDFNFWFQDAGNNNQVYSGTPTIPVPTSNEEGVAIPLTPTGGGTPKSIYVKTFKEEDVKVRDNLYSQWVRIYIDFGGAGFGGSHSRGYFGVVGSDVGNIPCTVEAVQNVGGAYTLSTPIPSTNLVWDATDLYLTTHATVRHDYLHIVPEPSSLRMFLLLFGCLVLNGFRTVPRIAAL